ncbi:MAG: hypothetical protein QM765_17615 [Myxococcales bacterium]
MISMTASLLLCVTVAATAPVAPSSRVEERAQARGIAPELTAQLVASVEAAQVANLPSETVEDKILEGLAKGVAADRIVTAAQDLQRRLGVAQQALDEAGVKVEAAERRAALERLAAAIRGDGQDLVAMARVAKGAGAPALTAAAREMVKLRAQGIEPAASIATLGALAKANHPEQIQRVSGLLADYVREGGTDNAGFLSEVRVRAESNQSLDDSRRPLRQPAGPAPALESERQGQGDGRRQGQLEQAEGAGAALAGALRPRRFGSGLGQGESGPQGQVRQQEEPATGMRVGAMPTW